MAKGQALIFGVSTPNPSGWTAAGLPGVREDCGNMERFLSGLGFQVTLRRDQGATKAEMLDGLNAAANELSAGDFFVFLYSGHGGQRPDTSDEEEDRFDEVYLPFDQEIRDDELGVIWPKFKPDVRVLVLTDSCHSGTGLRGALPPASETRGAAPRVATAPKLLGIGLPDATRSATRGASDVKKVQANLIHLSACQDAQTAADTSRGGAFTKALIQAMGANPKAFTGDYTELHKQIKSLVAAGGHAQISQLNKEGPGVEGFAKQRPFDLNAKVEIQLSSATKAKIEEGKKFT